MIPVEIVLPPELVHARELVDLHHLIQLAEVHHVVVLLCDGEGVPDRPALNVPLKLSDSRLKNTPLIIPLNPDCRIPMIFSVQD